MEKVKSFAKRKASFKKNNFSKKPKNNKRNVDNINLGKASSQRTKYLEKAKDALVIGDRITAEFFFQHADHYSRIIDSFENENNQQKQENISDKVVNDSEVAVKENLPQAESLIAS